MANFHKLFVSTLLAVVYAASTASAFGTPSATRRSIDLGSVVIEAYHPPSIFEVCLVPFTDSNFN